VESIAFIKAVKYTYAEDSNGMDDEKGPWYGDTDEGEDEGEGKNETDYEFGFGWCYMT